jgi:hypothetical protein
MHFEPEEHNFFKERRDSGVKDAAHGKRDFYEKLDKSEEGTYSRLCLNNW